MLLGNGGGGGAGAAAAVGNTAAAAAAATLGGGCWMLPGLGWWLGCGGGWDSLLKKFNENKVLCDVCLEMEGS